MDRDVRICYPSYILITSLFYPAILGSLFYFLLEDFSAITYDISKIIYIFASLAIIISFSIDFLYTYSSNAFYTKTLFSFDISILFLLFLSYKNLIEGIKYHRNIKLFFIGFLFIHLIFIFWDLFFIPKKKKSKRIIIFDLVGPFLSIIGLKFLSCTPMSGVFFLWFYTFTQIHTCAEEIFNRVSRECQNSR